MLYAPIISNKPITVNNRNRIILAVFAAGNPKLNIINSPINPIIKKGIPNIREPNTMCSPIIFPP